MSHRHPRTPHREQHSACPEMGKMMLTLKEAKVRSRRLKDSGDYDADIYKCPYCFSYHLGHKFKV